MANQIKISGYTVDLEEDFGGIKWWAVHYKFARPSMEIFKYVGQDRKKELYFFQSRNRDNILIKSLKGLELSIKDGSFKPFIIDTQKVKTFFSTED